MQLINWDQFKIKNPNYNQSFENLCYHLFCREFKISEGIKADFNQAGLETQPIRHSDGKYYGFQSKFFEHTTDYGQIEKSVKKALDTYKNLDCIYIYLNLNPKISSKPAKRIETIAKQKNVKIEWIVGSQFKILLNQPLNLALAQLYFGVGNELGFIKSCSNPKICTFLQSTEYMPLPFRDDKQRLNRIENVLLSVNQKEFLITGHPGSGKSIFMHKLFQKFGGLDKQNNEGMLKVLEKNNAVPMLVNLKNCAVDSLENILRGRQNDCNVRGRTGFIYLFDGLDELGEEKVDNALSYMCELNRQESTKKIIISCRSGNMNRMKAKVYLPKIIEYKIDDLSEKHITRYFKAKNDQSKAGKFKSLKTGNARLMADIKDILLIKLLWDTIDELDNTNTVIDLLSRKIDLLINSPDHGKNLEELNLLHPKKEKIIALNQDISFEFQKVTQFRFPQKDLQNLILKKFSRLDYQSVNNILNYLAGLFFENTYSDFSQPSYVYQHRRYQEFFFAQKLKSIYEENPKVLRDLKVLSNHEFFESLFMSYLRKEYLRENNLVGFIELNLIDIYLGKNKRWGADIAYYKNFREFIPALASQNHNLFEELVLDDSLQVKENILINLNVVKKQFSKLKKDKKDFSSREYLKNVWENKVALLIENIAIFWKAGKQDIANELFKNLTDIDLLFRKNKFSENFTAPVYLQDPFWNQFESWIYICLVVRGETAKDCFEIIKKNYADILDQRNLSTEESTKEKLVKSFFRVCLKQKPDELFDLLDELDEYQFIALLAVFTSFDFLPIFIRSASIHGKVKSFVENFPSQLTERNWIILFYKKFFGISLLPNETYWADAKLAKLKDDRQVYWQIHDTSIDYALVSYTLGRYSFEELLKLAQANLGHIYNELALYAALFNDYIQMLQGTSSIETIVRNYLAYLNVAGEHRSELYLTVGISSFWAYIFTNSRVSQQTKLTLKTHLVTKENLFVPFRFYYELNQLNPLLFCQLVNASELKVLEEELLNWSDDFPSYIDRCFDLSTLFAKIDDERAKFYFKKGINDGILRHGWRSDIIVSYMLVDALEVLWRNNWVSRERLKTYTLSVFSLTVRVSEITDGKETWRGPYNVIQMASKYDLHLAEHLKSELIKKRGYQRFASNLAVTSILLGKINLGLSIDEIEKGITEYEKDYDYKGGVSSDYYEHMFNVYIAIARNSLYPKNVQKNSFEKAYEQMEKLKGRETGYPLEDTTVDNLTAYRVLCDGYNKECNLPPKENKEAERKPKITEDDFIREVGLAKTKPKIKWLYKELGEYNNKIILTKYGSWESLVKKTYEVCGNIELFVNLLKENSFPHTDRWTSNSRYFHLGLAVALKQIDTRPEMLRYLSENSGRGGFVNVLKAYEINQDKQMGLKLFDRYLLFCDFLVN
jgi:hypothetical protein